MAEKKTDTRKLNVLAVTGMWICLIAMFYDYQNLVLVTGFGLCVAGAVICHNDKTQKGTIYSVLGILFVIAKTILTIVAGVTAVQSLMQGGTL